MSASIGYEFPVDAADQWDGFNEPGIEHFSGNPYVYLGREVTQNPLDAAVSAPVRIEMNLIEVPTSSIPDVDDLKKIFARCASAAEQESEKAKAFFKEAIALLGKPKIPVLQISDYNTTGLVGPCENGTPYFALLKASGQSKKATGTSIGSFGIGKFAPFAVSQLRTIFVSTVWKDGDTWRHYVQGKSILMSHYGSGKKTHKGIGFWGRRNKCLPIEGLDPKLPKWLKRAKSKADMSSQAGTTINVLGFRTIKNWERILAAAIAENFFGAISQGQLEVTIQNSITLSKETLPDLFQDKHIRDAVQDMSGEPEKFDNAQKYLMALGGSSEVIVEETQQLHLGLCELRLILGENLPKRVAVLRDGMLITEELSNLRRFGDFKEFVAVLECKSEKGLRLLRDMEPPKHDDFEPERLSSDKDRRKGQLALRELTKWVREMLKRHAQDPISEVTQIDELAEFFGDETQSDQGGGDQEENPSGDIIIRARRVDRRPDGRTNDPNASSGEDASDEDSAGGGTGGKGKKSGGEGQIGAGERDGDGAGVGVGNNGTGAGRANGKSNTGGIVRVGLRDLRAVPLSPRRRRILFTPERSGIISLVLEDSGADANYKLEPVATSAGRIVSGKIQDVQVQAGSRVSIEVELKADFDGTLRVAADAV